MEFSNYKLTLGELKENKQYYFFDPNGTLDPNIVIKKVNNLIYLAHYVEYDDGHYEIEKIIDNEPTCYVISEQAIDLCPDIFEKDFKLITIGEFYSYCFSILYEMYYNLSKGIPATYKEAFKEIKADSLFSFAE